MLPFVDEWMRRMTLRMQLSPKLERFRAHVPYFVVIFLLVIFLELPAVFLLLLAQCVGYKGTPEMSLARSWLTLAACPPGFAAVILLVAVVGRLSGFCPFQRCWNRMSREEFVRLSAQIRQGAVD